MRMYWIVILVLVFLSPVAHGNHRKVFGYTVLPESRITISGTTNINKFACLSISESPTGSFLLEETALHGRSFRFHNADLKIRVSSFDCGHRVMNRDMHQAMGGDHFPYITIKIEEATITHFNPEAAYGSARVLVAITLNGITQNSIMNVMYKAGDNNRVAVEASKKMRMSDFEVNPPSPALGLVKVNDEVTISLRLKVEAGLLGVR